MGRGVCNSWDKVDHNTVWRVGNGANINCWRDNWLPVVGKLEGSLQRPLSVVEAALQVKDLINDQGEWSVAKLSNTVLDEVIQVILTLNPLNLDRGDDRIDWGLAKDGAFSSKSAYESLLQGDIPLPNPILNLNWTW